mgnify:CR=1 FL=1
MQVPFFFQMPRHRSKTNQLIPVIPSVGGHWATQDWWLTAWPLCSARHKIVISYWKNPTQICMGDRLVYSLDWGGHKQNLMHLFLCMFSKVIHVHTEYLMRDKVEDEMMVQNFVPRWYTMNATHARPCIFHLQWPETKWCRCCMREALFPFM